MNVTVMPVAGCHSGDEMSSKPIRHRRFLSNLFTLLLLPCVFSLATLAKVVTYTPRCHDSALYSSNAGRRMVSSSRRLTGKQAAAVQSVKRPIARFRERPSYSPARSRVLVSANRPGVIPLRSPPSFL